MTAPSPYAIQAAMAAAQSALSRLEASGDVDTDEAAALAVLREEAPDIEVVLTRIARAKREAAGRAKAAAEWIAELQDRKRRFERQEEEYNRTMFAILSALGLRKFTHGGCTISMHEGQAGVVITDDAALPDQFVRIRKEPDKTAIGCVLREGHEVPGALLSNGTPYIKVKFT